MLQSYNLLRRFVVTLHKIGGASAIKVNFIALDLHYFCIKYLKYDKTQTIKDAEHRQKHTTHSPALDSG